MADPLSVAASIASLVTLAELVFTRAFAFVKAVKGAPKEIARLSSGTGALYGVLSRLHLLCMQLERDENDVAITTRAHVVHDCTQTLRKISIKLDACSPSTSGQHRLSSLGTNIRWPFSTKEVEQLIAEVERHKNTLSLALTADTLSKVLLSLSKQEGIQEDIREIKDELIRRRDAETFIAINDERRRILKSFGSINPEYYQDTNTKLRHHATGLWLTEGDELKIWLVTKNGRLWYFGIPGAGKTVLAASVIEEALK